MIHPRPHLLAEDAVIDACGRKNEREREAERRGGRRVSSE